MATQEQEGMKDAGGWEVKLREYGVSPQCRSVQLGSGTDPSTVPSSCGSLQESQGRVRRGSRARAEDARRRETSSSS